MEKSILYDVLSKSVFHKWKSELQKTENYFTQHVKEIMEKLEIELDEKSKDLLTSYTLAVEDKMDYLYYNLNIKILNFGIKIGMESVNALHEENE